MVWNCKMLDVVGTKKVTYDPPLDHIVGETVLVLADGREINQRSLFPGDMFYMPKGTTPEGWPWYLAKEGHLSDYYSANNSHRQPLFLMLPGKHLFLVDGKCWNQQLGRYGGWHVRGEAPNISVFPSIDISGTYHGCLSNGILGDDIVHRKYDVNGSLIGH